MRRIFELYAAGNHSIRDLVEYARQQGLPTRATGRGMVTHTTINEMLRNPFYIGKFRWADQMWEGKHDPIVSQALFDQVQAIMDGRYGGVFETREFAFTGLLRCGYCGYKITAELKRKPSGKTYVYYHCCAPTNKDKRKERCPKPHVREEVLKERLGGLIAQLQMDERVFETFRTALKASAAEQQQFHEEAVTTLQQKEAKLQKRLKALYLDKLDGSISPEEYQRMREEWEDELARVRGKLETHHKADRRYVERGVQLLELAQTAYPSFLRRSGKDQRKLLDFVISNCLMTADALIPTYRKPFDIIASAAASTQENRGPDTSDPDLCQVRYPQRGSNPCYHLERVVS